MDVSIIIINYKTSLMTKNAINSIVNKSSDFSYEIIIVDNSNDPFYYNELKQELAGFNVKIINANKNLGFGNGNNLGASYSSGKYLYFINSDTLLINNAIYYLFEFMENNTDSGIVGSNLYKEDLSENHSYYLDELNLKNYKKSFSFFRKNWIKRQHNFTNETIKISGYVCGASLMIKKTLFDSLGGFEPTIFMYAEEALMCYRVINEFGLCVYNIPNSKIIHFDGGSFGSESLFRIQEQINGQYIYFSKAFGEKTGKKFLFFLRKKCLIRIIVFRFLSLKKYDYYQKKYKVVNNKIHSLK